jgi:hypothetical protein
MIAPDGSGGAIVAWGDSRLSSYSIYSNRVLRNGLIASGWPVDGAPIGDFSASSYMSEGRGVSDDAGGAYFVWGGDDASSNPSILLQHVTGAGGVAAGWPTDRLVARTRHP